VTTTTGVTTTGVTTTVGVPSCKSKI
jgi:hypothetical protein